MLCIPTRLVVLAATTGFALSGCASTSSPGEPVSTQKATQPSTQQATAVVPQKGATTKTPKTRPAPTASNVLVAKDALGDVKLSAIRIDAKLRTPSAEVTLTNRSSKRSNYVVDLRIMSPGGKTEIDAAMVNAQGLAPGQTIKKTAQFNTTQKLPKGATLTILGVARMVA